MVNYFEIQGLKTIGFTVLSFSETFKIHFRFQTLTEILQLNLVLVSGECEVNCDGRCNKCNVSLEERSMTNVSIPPLISIRPQRPGWQEPEPSNVTGKSLAHCILGKSLGIDCHCFPPALDVPTFAPRSLYVRNDARDPSSYRWKCGREIFPVILPKFRLPLKFSDLLHAENLRHGTDGFISPLKEGVQRILSP